MEEILAKVDLHNHLRTSSYITKRDANAAVGRAARVLGPRGVMGIVSFNPSEDRIDTRRQRFIDNLRYDTISTGNGLYLPEKKLLVVWGQELPTDKGYHVLVSGVPEKESIKNGTTLEEISQCAKDWGALLVMDHPCHHRGFYTEQKGYQSPMLDFIREKKAEIETFDLIETYNSEAALDLPSAENANELAEILWSSLKMSPIKPQRCVSSDGHSISEIGRSYTIMNMPHNYCEEFKGRPDRVMNALRKGYAHPIRHSEKPSRIGALNHIADLAILITMNKKFGWSDDQTARFFQRFGISI